MKEIGNQKKNKEKNKEKYKRAAGDLSAWLRKQPTAQ
jgi:hypothetical protein